MSTDLTPAAKQLVRALPSHMADRGYTLDELAAIVNRGNHRLIGKGATPAALGDALEGLKGLGLVSEDDEGCWQTLEAGHLAARVPDLELQREDDEPIPITLAFENAVVVSDANAETEEDER